MRHVGHTFLAVSYTHLILAREELGSTYFGNKIAIPHPLCPITEETFVVAGLLDREISWSESEKVRIVLMVSAEANNPKAFQLWHYLSSLVCNKKLVNELLSDLSYENLLKQLDVYKRQLHHWQAAEAPRQRQQQRHLRRRQRPRQRRRQRKRQRLRRQQRLLQKPRQSRSP